MDYWWLVPLAYLVGSIPWGLLVVRLVSRVDIRDYGSGGTGVTNVLRTAGRGPAAVVLLADAGKGAAMALTARLLTDNAAVHATVAGVAIAGHVWPVLAGFRGGRGIATGGAAAAALQPLAALAGLVAFVVVVALTRYVSLGSVSAVVVVVAVFAAAWAIDSTLLPYFLFAITSGSLILLMHRGNIGRLLRGTEPRLGERAR